MHTNCLFVCLFVFCFLFFVVVVFFLVIFCDNTCHKMANLTKCFTKQDPKYALFFPVKHIFPMVLLLLSILHNFVN